MIAYDSTSTFTQSGGTFTANTLDLSSLSTSKATYNLNGGTLNANVVSGSNGGSSGTSIFNFNGGMLQAAASNAAFFQG